MSSSQETIIGRAVTLADLLQYQHGAVVSRTLVDRPVGTLTVFAFDEGQGLSEHSAPYDAIVQVLDGAVDVTIDGVAHRLVAGQMIIMPANHPHSLKAAGPFKMLLTMIRG
jgi:quercetin dioxygenase-like cupin family protein